MFLTHQDGDEKVGDDSVGNLSGARLVSRCETNKYGHVGREGNTEKLSVNGEEHITEVPDWPEVLLVEGSLLAGHILRRVARRSRPRDSFLRFCSGREADDFRFLSSRL